MILTTQQHFIFNYFKELFDTTFTMTIFRYERTVIDKCRRIMRDVIVVYLCEANSIMVLDYFLVTSRDRKLTGSYLVLMLRLENEK